MEKENYAGNANDIQRTRELEEELRQLKNGDARFWGSEQCPADLRVSNLEDILAFESVESGISLFEGFQQHGIDLPNPATLNEQQSAAKAGEIILALEELQILLIGFEEMSARQFYRTLWHTTLWEGCYVKKRDPRALTIIDVSHQIPQSEILKFLEEMTKRGTVQ
jgi:hypothetical protein